VARAPKLQGEVEALPQSDQIEGLCHPRLTEKLIGHEAQKKAFTDAVASGRLHHAWLLTGPRGLGKASFAYQAAGMLLTQNAGFGFDAFHPASQRIRQASHGNIRVLNRSWDPSGKKFRANIRVDEVRALTPFFGSSAAEEGPRIVIVDCADDLNVNSANALLKSLEEPPKDGFYFLVAHAPGRLLPTIRSRCRTLAFAPLPDHEVAEIMRHAMPNLSDDEARAFAHLADNSPGRALELALAGGLELFQALIDLFADLPRLDGLMVAGLADDIGAAGQDARFDLTMVLLRGWLRRLAKGAAIGQPVSDLVLLKGEEGPARTLTALGPEKIIALHDQLGEWAGQTKGLFLDRRQSFIRMAEALAAATQGR